MSHIIDEQIDDWITTLAAYDLAGPKLLGRDRIHRFARAVLALAGHQSEPMGEIVMFGPIKEVSWRKGKMPDVGTKLYAGHQSERPAPAGQAVGEWIALVKEKADHARENANALRKYPGQEQEARARELAATYLMEMAQCLSMDEAHAEALEGVAAIGKRLAKVRSELAASQAERPAVKEKP